jgi:hypothetical protein
LYDSYASAQKRLRRWRCNGNNHKSEK